ncbi:MAG: NPCBM/NEW2 domain-containing protein, partial [Pirellulales bacterium]
MVRLGLALSLALAGSAALPAAEQQSQLVRVGGAVAAARLIGADERWSLTFENGSRQQLHVGELVRWGTPREPADATGILLRDGGMLPGKITAASESVLELQSDALGAIKLPRKLVAAAVLAATALSEERAATGVTSADQLRLANGDRLAGRLLGMAEKKIQWEARQGRITVSTENVARIEFAQREAAPPQHDRLKVTVGLDDGTRLLVDQLVTKENRAEIVLADGTRVATELRRVVFLQPRGGRVTWLSDLKPQGYRHLPYLSVEWPLALDRNVLGGPLRAGGRPYLKGLGLHSASRVTYQLEKPYRRLAATLAIDDAAEHSGSVIFHVFTDDGTGRWTERFSSPTARGGAPPIEMAVDVAGAKRVSLLVDGADYGDQRDYANWLDARLEP